MRRVASSVCLLASMAAAAAEPPKAVVLLQSQGYVHDVVKRAEDGGPSVVERVLGEIAKESGAFAPWFTEDATTLTADSLRDVKLVVMFTSGDELPLDAEALDAWVRGGGAFLGIHSATDTLRNDATFLDLIGAAFREHPWGAGDTVTVRADDPAHPAAKPYAPAATFKEEVYCYRAPLDDEHVVLSLDQEATEKKIATAEAVPIAWCREHGRGRVFYTSLGHREDTWRSDAFREHLLGAASWLLGGAGVTAADGAEAGGP